jgi:hypothetical protein
VTFCYDCEHVSCSFNDGFSLVTVYCELFVQASKVEPDIVRITERSRFVKFCCDCEHV